MKKLTILLALFLFVIGSVFAQRVNRSSRSAGNGIDRTQYDLRVKIADGIVNGEITAREARRLLEVSEDISYRKIRMGNNGRLSQRELDRLRRDLRRLDRMIVREVGDSERVRKAATGRNGRYASNNRGSNNGRVQRF